MMRRRTRENNRDERVQPVVGGRGRSERHTTQHRHHHFAALAEFTSNTTKSSILSIIST